MEESENKWAADHAGSCSCPPLPPPWPHSSCPDANGCYRLAPSLHAHYNPFEPLFFLLFLTRLAGNLTQKLVETNYSNDSRCPPANICHHYRCPASGSKWLCFYPSLNKDWGVGGSGGVPTRWSYEVFAPTKVIGLSCK